jgi:predicted nucleic acid-binding protein
MTALVVDCSVTMAWCFEGETTEFTEAALDAVANRSAVVPALWALEVANVLALGVRRRLITDAKLAGFRDKLARLAVRLEPVSQERALGSVLSLARRHNLTSYDASYLELAKRLALPLATLDARLIAGAKAEDVPLFDA